MNAVTRIQILNEEVCISQSTNNLGKDMNPTILSRYQKTDDHTGFFNPGMATSLVEGNLRI